MASYCTEILIACNLLITSKTSKWFLMMALSRPIFKINFSFYVKHLIKTIQLCNDQMIGNRSEDKSIQHYILTLKEKASGSNLTYII